MLTAVDVNRIVLADRKQVVRVIKKYASKIAELCQKKCITNLLLAKIEKGGVLFHSILAVEITKLIPDIIILPVTIRVTRYGNKHFANSSEKPTVVFLDLIPEFEGYKPNELYNSHWLVPDDIGDEFITLECVFRAIRRFYPSSFHSVTLVRREGSPIPKEINLISLGKDDIFAPKGYWAEGMGMGGPSNQFAYLDHIRAYIPEIEN